MAPGIDPAGPPEPAGQSPYDAEEADERSLLEDVHALIDDGKTYLQAELAFQKTRAGFLAEEAKGVATFGALAAVLGLLGLIGLTVGLIIALTPHLTAWGATAVVVGVLLLGAALLARTALGHVRRISGAMRSAPEETR